MYRNPIPTTDIIIEYDNGKKQGIVLIERLNPPYGLAIPGGFCEEGLSFEENAAKEAKEETNLEVYLKNPGRPYVYSDPKRDPRGHFVSNTYYAHGLGELQHGSDAKAADVYTLAEVRSLIEQDALAFDHAKILSDWLENRSWKFEHERILQKQITEAYHG